MWRYFMQNIDSYYFKMSLKKGVKNLQNNAQLLEFYPSHQYKTQGLIRLNDPTPLLWASPRSIGHILFVKIILSFIIIKQ